MDEMISRNADLEAETVRYNNDLAQVVSGIDILQQVDLSTLQVIQKLFTGPGNGPAFLAQILRFAEVKQMALPGVEGITDVAVITLQTIRELAKKIQWGYDTTHKYVVVFCALNLLVKRRYEGRIQLLFSLKQYTPPPTSKALDDLINKSRPKVRQFAVRIKHRCILYNIIQQDSGQQEGHSTHSTLERQLLVQLQSILQDEHIDQTQRQRLMMRISSEIFSKLIIPSNTVETIPARLVSPEPEKIPCKVSSPIVDSVVLAPIADEKMITHNPTSTQADIVTSGSRVTSKEETRISSVAELEVISPADKEIISSQEETFKRESPPTQKQQSIQERLLENGKTHETSFNGREESESTSTNDQATLKELLSKQFSSTPSSRQKQQPTRISSILSHASPVIRVDSPVSSDSARNMATPSQKTGEDSRMLKKNESTTKNMRREDSQALQKVSPSPINEQREDSRNPQGDSQAPDQLSEPPNIEKSPAEKESSEQPEGKGDFSHGRVDFSTITQIHIEHYSESFLRAYVTLNVIDFINKNYNNNVNVTSRTELAKFLAEIMDGDPEKWKIHMKLLNNCDADVVVGALIHTFSKLYDRGGESIHNKAGFFTKHCKDFQASGVPLDKIMLVNSLKHLNFEQIIKHFEAKQQQVLSHQPAQAAQTQPSQPGERPAANSIFALEVPRETNKIIVRQGGRTVVQTLNYGRFSAKKKRLMKDP